MYYHTLAMFFSEIPLYGVILSYFISTVSANGTRGFLCSSCKDIDSPENCDAFEICYPDEKCIKTTYLSNGGHLRYFLGCEADDKCQGPSSFLTFSDMPDNKTNILRHTCCQGDGCNSPPPIPGWTRCFKCSTTSNVTTCDQTLVCGEHQVCSYLESVVLTSAGPKIQYDLDCLRDVQCVDVDNADCHLVPSQRLSHRDSNTFICTSRLRCCNDELCNMKYALALNNLTYHEIPTTVGTTPEATTTTTTNTNIATTTTTPATTSVSTISTTTTTSKQTQCFLGKGKGLESTCFGDRPLCMTNVTNYKNGYREVDNCAGASQCHLTFSGMNQLHPFCEFYKEDNIYLHDFRCTYCCDHDRCNAGVVPPRETFFISSIAPPIL